MRNAARADKADKIGKMENVEPAPVREVMDIRQAADYLGISADSLYRYASENTVPAFRLGNRWRFKKSRLDAWMDEQSGGGEKAPKLIKPRQKKPVRAVR
jgi:excisionase family DNA binding protein